MALKNFWNPSGPAADVPSPTTGHSGTAAALTGGRLPRLGFDGGAFSGGSAPTWSED
jgi:hypothetical protein